MVDPLERLKTALADRYLIERELGAGGMATVYLAEDRKLGRAVALKVLRPELAASLGGERFVREIEIAAKLTHPHILPLYDCGEAGGQLYYTMPFVDGESLRDRLEREKQLPVEDALQITQEVADALGYAHALGLVHRDIKPENILFAAGHGVVADFGIARAVSAAGGARLTGTGLAVGTPQYMSPEQAAGEADLDGRSDLYSLGCVLYEMLAGEPPFTGPTAQAVIAKRFSGVVPRISVVRATVTPGLEHVLDKLLASVPADRFATASQLVTALTAEASSPSRSPSPQGSASVPPPRGTRRRRLALAAAAAAVLVVAAVIALWVARGHAPPPGRDLIAVAPFDVLEPGLQLWSDGLVDVLSAGLDGAGPLRAISPTLVIRRWSGRADAASAALLAGRTGAGLVVFGRLVGSGADSVRASAAILDAATGRTLGEVEVRDLTVRIDRLADSLTLGLLRELGRSRPIGAARLASLGSTSLPALKAFLEGEQYFRRTVWDSALASYQRAVDLDSTFTVALRRVAHVLGWQRMAADSLSHVYLLRAGRLNHGLSARDSLLVVADSLFAALYEREADAAWWAQATRMTAVLDGAAQRYPQDPEVWFQVGEAGFHWGLWIGVTQSAVMQAFTRAIGLDSAFAPAYIHLVALALELEGPAAARRLASAYLALHPADVEATALRIASQLLDGARPWTDEITRQLDTASAPVLFEVWAALESGHDPAEPEVRLARLFAAGRPGAPPSLADPSFRAEILSGTLARRGHLHQAYLAAGAERPELIADFAMVGGLPADTLGAIFRRRLESANEDAPWALAWWAGQGDTASILESLRQSLAVSRDPEAARRRHDRAVYWAGAARGYLVLSRHDTAAALRSFLALPDSLCETCYLPRLTTAHLLVDRGRYAEAGEFLRREVTGKIGGSAIAAVLWKLERARNAERTGDRAGAIRAYEEVAALWRNGDPALRPILDSVAAALERLDARRGS